MACGTGDWDRNPGSGRAADLFGHAAYLCKASAGAVLLSGPAARTKRTPVPDVHC